MKQLHSLQLQILKNLLFADSLSFSKLKPSSSLENNQFVFHLDELIKAGFIDKNQASYRLTSKGKEYANRMDTEKTLIQTQAKVSVWICITRKVKSTTEYLIYTRLKQPFYGKQGFMSGKVAYGEKVVDTAKREFKEETNLVGEPKVISIKHFRVFDKKSRELLEDKFFILCLIKSPSGRLKPSKEGRFEWVAEKDFKSYVTNHFESYKTFLKYVAEIKNFDGKVTFEEIDHYTESF